MHAVAHATADEPLCSHHPDKRWVPVPPVGFLHVARCWLATHRLAAMGQDPHHWGRCRRPVRPNVLSTCPQGEPLIPRGSISVDAAERRNRFKVDALRGFLSDGRCPLHDEEGRGGSRGDYEGDGVCLALAAPTAAGEGSAPTIGCTAAAVCPAPIASAPLIGACWSSAALIPTPSRDQGGVMRGPLSASCALGLAKNSRDGRPVYSSDGYILVTSLGTVFIEDSIFR
jgi:hypothetical protein